MELQEELGLTYLFISHDLAVVRHISRRVGVMYLGRIVEIADTDMLFARPAHPYTMALVGAVLVPDPGQRRQRLMLAGDPASAKAAPTGCRFRNRCPMAQERCGQEDPVLREIRPGQWAACHFAEDN